MASKLPLRAVGAFAAVRVTGLGGGGTGWREHITVGLTFGFGVPLKYPSRHVKSTAKYLSLG